MKKYDAIIIGSGQGGNPLAKKLAGEGWNTLLIEKEHIGGTCVNTGCTPSKTLVASAKRIYDCRTSNELGVYTENVHLNMQEVVSRKDHVVESFRNSAREGLEETKKVTLIFGEATFTGKKEIAIQLNEGGKEAVTSPYIFIDVGARPRIPDINGLDKIDYLTSTSIMDLKEVPAHLLVIGGGYIGLELGQAFSRFGSKVTIVEGSERFLHQEDQDIADCIYDLLTKEGIDIRTGTKVIRVSNENGAPSATLKTGDREESVAFTHLLVAAGRQPNTDLLKTDAGGIELDENGFIKVNEHLQTSVDGIFALGDVKGGPEFTHVSYHDHYVLFKNIIKRENIDYHVEILPYTMFTDPQLGRVGMSEQQAKEKGRNYKVARLPMKRVARAIEVGDTRGMMKAVVDAESGQILGAAIIGEQGGEIMTILQMAMVGKVTWQIISELPIAHPLYAESLNNLFLHLR